MCGKCVGCVRGLSLVGGSYAFHFQDHSSQQASHPLIFSGNKERMSDHEGIEDNKKRWRQRRE